MKIAKNSYAELELRTNENFRILQYDKSLANILKLMM